MSEEKFCVLLLLGLIFIGTACEHYQPMDFPAQNGERQKPGLFSGKSGAFEIPLSQPESTTP